MKTPAKPSGQLAQLRAFTPARIGLRRAGTSQTTRDILRFDRDHALARDAVHLPFDATELKRQLAVRSLNPLLVHSRANDRSTYLQRPDLGRRLNDASGKRLAAVVERLKDTGSLPHTGFDLAVVVADGLSTHAVHTNAIPFLDAFLPKMGAQGWRCAPIVIANQARVAIADDIGSLLGARLSVILIGERPGLSAADSMGVYLTYAPRSGRTDAERNCISNIRAGGLSFPAAADQLVRLIAGALDQKCSGVGLKVGSSISMAQAPGELR